ncbi:MAG: hypothetical protein IBX40_06570 [Methanosarcinales archaeon]|nr:hypothetical protein [Methanosarcinales archaeon]
MSTLSLSTIEKLPEVTSGMNIDTILKLYRHHWDRDSLLPKGAIMGPNLDNGVVVNYAMFEELIEPVGQLTFKLKIWNDDGR